MEKQYSIGLDYGTLSVRGVLLDMDTGEEAAVESYEYPHGVLSSSLPDENQTKIPNEYALAVPEDYLEGLGHVVKNLLRNHGVKPGQIRGIGMDVTSASVIPVDEKGRAMSMVPGFESHPHSYIKLWKHHGAKEFAEKMERTARDRGEDWLSLVGGKISCEMFIPKTLETQGQDPEVYEQCYTFLEVGDWLTWYMTGTCSRSASMAGCNSYYRRGIGYPSEEYFQTINPDVEPVTEKYKGTFIPLGRRAGYLTKEAAKVMGLNPGIPVAAPMVDSHASVVGAGADQVGDMTAVMGTSACYLMNSHTGEGIPGIYSSVYEAHIPDMFGYEGGQSCVGECLEWYVKNCVPARYEEAAEKEGVNIHTYLQDKIKETKPEEWKLLALDWWNGVRSPLMRPELTGVMTGFTIHTRPEEVYGALLESLCFGARVIIDTFYEAGHPVERLFATGGISGKSPVMMQMLADICGIEIQVCESRLASARGSAIMGAAVSDMTEQNSRTLKDWIHKLGSPIECVYYPNYQKRDIYEERYRRYRELAELFSGRDTRTQEEVR